MAELTGVAIEALPEAARGAALRLRDGLIAILGDDLVALWIHGGLTFPDRSRRSGDLDVGAFVSGITADERSPRLWRANPASRPSRIRALHDGIRSGLGIEIDATYVRLEDAGSRRPPAAAFDRADRVNDWAIQRAHWASRQFVRLHGPTPDTFVTAPTTAEIRRALDRELEHLERHVAEGDAADPFEATYAIWNGCRILRTLATGDPVVSKRSAGEWGLEHLSRRWHPVIRAAGRAYDGEASDSDRALLEADMAPFVAMVRRRLPRSSRRGSAPRWS